MHEMHDRRRVVPDDPRIPALALLEGAGKQRLLELAGLGGGPLEIEVLKHHPRKRCVLRLSAGGHRVIVKAYGRRGPGLQMDLMRAFQEKGLASGAPPTVPPVLGVDEGLGVIVTACFESPTAAGLISSGNGARGGQLGAEWLRAVASSDITPGHLQGTQDSLERAERWVRTIADADAELGAMARDIVATLSRRPPRNGAMSLVHREFSTAHVFDLEGGPGVIDWDSFARGPLELDAAFYLATIQDGRLAETESSRAAREEFLAGIADLVDAYTLHWYCALTLVQYSKPFARKRAPDWQQIIRTALKTAQGLAQSI
jgi:hypothetical protein